MNTPPAPPAALRAARNASLNDVGSGAAGMLVAGAAGRTPLVAGAVVFGVYVGSLVTPPLVSVLFAAGMPDPTGTAGLVATVGATAGLTVVGVELGSPVKSPIGLPLTPRLVSAPCTPPP